MIILKLQAGLGNQMFQYAYARALALRSSRALNENIELGLNLSWFDNINKKDTPRYYELKHLNIKARIVSEEETRKALGPKDSALFRLARKVSRKIKRGLFGWSDYVFHPDACKPKRTTCIEGYWWNSELYFKDFANEIKKEFSLKESLGNTATEAKTLIESTSKEGKIPVLIHVRRGDYITNIHALSFHGAKDLTYYDAAVETLIEKLGKDKEPMLHFFAVSDDIEWTKQNVKPKSKLSGAEFPITYISKPEIKAHEEMNLMSLCHHHIIANSTFSWWGAWLSENPSKVVIGPKQWVLDPKVNTKDVMPESWIRI